RTEFGTAARLRAPSVKQLRRGVPTGTGQHLLTMFLTDAGWLVVDSALLWDLAVELGVVGRGRYEGVEHPFATPLGARRLVERIGLDRAERLGILIAGDPGEALVVGLARLWDLGDLGPRALAGALAEGGPWAHLLRFSHTGTEVEDAGGYSIAVIG
ncbi:MAG: hypothetical protein ACRYG2_05010, partial [Janthinobacterium lividum]